jgi:hypothetical protein
MKARAPQTQPSTSLAQHYSEVRAQTMTLARNVSMTLRHYLS